MINLEFVIIGILAFALEFLDNSMGGGFGTMTSPILLLAGFDPHSVVPAVLFSETASGFFGGSWHSYYQNVRRKPVAIMCTIGIYTMVIASILVGDILPQTAVKIYIIIVIFAMASLTLLKSFQGTPARRFNPSSKKIALLGAIVGF